MPDKVCSKLTLYLNTKQNTFSRKKDYQISKVLKFMQHCQICIVNLHTAVYFLKTFVALVRDPNKKLYSDVSIILFSLTVNTETMTFFVININLDSLNKISNFSQVSAMPDSSSCR